MNAVVLITGCSSGFGFATALHLAERGCRVIATMRNLKKKGNLEATAADKNLEITILPLDVTVVETIMAVKDYITQQKLQLDVLINNAGYGIGGFFEDLTDREFRDQMETNFFGILNASRIFLPLLRRNKGGMIINISSVAGLTATPSLIAYNTSKWAIEGFSEALRLELKLMGVKVFLIEPGPYPTKVLTDNVRFAEGSDHEESPYYPYSRRILMIFEEQNRNIQSDVSDISRKIESIIRGKTKNFRNILGGFARLRYLLRKYLPYRLYEFLVFKVMFSKRGMGKVDKGV